MQQQKFTEKRKKNLNELRKSERIEENSKKYTRKMNKNILHRIKNTEIKPG